VDKGLVIFYQPFVYSSISYKVTECIGRIIDSALKTGIKSMCQFNLSFSGDLESLLKRAKQEIEKAGGNLEGDLLQGQFRARTPIGSVSGSYEIAGQQIALSIAKKPLLISCKRIEKELASVMQ